MLRSAKFWQTLNLQQWIPISFTSLLSRKTPQISSSPCTECQAMIETMLSCPASSKVCYKISKCSGCIRKDNGNTVESRPRESRHDVQFRQIYHSSRLPSDTNNFRHALHSTLSCLHLHIHDQLLKISSPLTTLSLIRSDLHPRP